MCFVNTVLLVDWDKEYLHKRHGGGGGGFKIGFEARVTP
jgi:hypothetical protein